MRDGLIGRIGFRLDSYGHNFFEIIFLMSLVRLARLIHRITTKKTLNSSFGVAGPVFVELRPRSPGGDQVLKTKKSLITASKKKN